MKQRCDAAAVSTKLESAWEVLMAIVILVICGVIAAVIAHTKGRNPVGWFFAGFFIHVIGIIIVAVLPNLKEERARQARMEGENRRLREQLRQEQIKGETYRQYSMDRLDAHDGALGMNTRSLPGGSGAAAPQLAWDVDASVQAATAADSSGKPWFYERGGESAGPVPAREIRVMLQTAQITPRTLVWSEGMAQWAPLSEVPSLNQDVMP
jgi:hypothetical protein